MYDFHGQLIPEPGGEELVAGENRVRLQKMVVIISN